MKRMKRNSKDINVTAGVVLSISDFKRYIKLNAIDCLYQITTTH